jgi:hypothetical protein
LLLTSGAKAPVLSGAWCGTAEAVPLSETKSKSVKQIPFGNDKQESRNKGSYDCKNKQQQEPMRGFFASLRMTSVC